MAYSPPAVFRFVTAFFLSTTALACLTGFLFPFHAMTLSIEMAIPDARSGYARGHRALYGIFAGMWRHTYVVSVMVALYCKSLCWLRRFFSYLAPNARTPWEYGRLYKLAQSVFLRRLLSPPILL